jgi:hypothetical protein
MKAAFKITASLLSSVRSDLARTHPFAYERVGFLTAGCAWTSGGDLLVVTRGYLPVEDDDYVMTDAVGAQINTNAMRQGVQAAYRSSSALFHVHTHGGRGTPGFSRVDLRSGVEFVPSFFHLIPTMPHGLIVLSDDSADGLLWLDRERKPIALGRFVSVGARLQTTGRHA